LVPLLIGILATVLTLFTLIAYHPEIIVLLLAQQGEEVKESAMFDIATSVYLAPLILTAIVWWAYWRLPEFALRGWRSGIVKLALVVAVLSEMATATLIMSRGILMMTLCGLTILLVIRRSAQNKMSWRFILATGLGFVICAALLFVLFSFIRGTDNSEDQVRNLVGYTVAPYNRLAAVVNGNMRYPFAGRGLYLSSFVAFNHTFNRFVPVSGWMNWPDQLEVWGSEFGAVNRAGLDGSLILSGSFGYIFSDLGWWFSLPFVFCYGLLYGVVWNWIRRGNTLGVVLYPVFSFCALLWIGTNSLLDSPQVLVLVAGIGLAGYEFMFLKSTGISDRT
jgi:oligosaccharide repeat unit polymerase